MPSIMQRAELRNWVVAGLIAAAAIAPAGCSGITGSGVLPARAAEQQSRALPATQSRALPANQSRALPAAHVRATDEAPSGDA